MSTSEKESDKGTTPFPTKENNPKEQDEAVDKALDEAIEESFPASDPVAITTEKPDNKAT